MRQSLILAVAVGLSFFWGVELPDTTSLAAAAEPQKRADLPLVFEEDMSSEPFSRFKPLGPSGGEWSRGSHWTIHGPSVFFREARSGRDAQLSARMEFPRLKEGEKSETRLGLVYQNNQVGVVVFNRQREGDKTISKIVLQRQPDILVDVGVSSRKIEVQDDLPSGNWAIQVRAGAVTLSCDGKEIGRGTFDTHTVPIFGIAIAQPSSSVTIRRMAYRASGTPPEPSGQQKEQAIAAARTNDEAGRLVRAKQHAEALEKAREVVPMYEKLYGREHHDVANAYFNLGVVLKQAGKPTESVEAFKEALAIRKGLFGADHPDTAQIEMEITVVLVDLMKLEAAFPHCMSAHLSFATYYGDDNRSTILTRQILEKLPRPQREDET